MLKEEVINQRHITKAEKLYAENSDKLDQYITLLLDWNADINLMSRSVSRETIQKHVVHSLVPAAMGLLDDSAVWVDAGTGGGLPGIPLSIVMREKKWILNDNIRKKMKVVSAIADSMGLDNVEIQAKSISLVTLPKGAGIVTKHAFKIPNLLRLLKGKAWHKIVMWKGAEGGREEFRKAGKGIEATIFEFNAEDPFYEGKAIVKLNRSAK